MITIPAPESQSPIESALLIPMTCEDCDRQISLARKELGAFLTAVQQLYGDNVVARVAEVWLTLLESPQPPWGDGRLTWRHITIVASSRLAIDRSTGGAEGEER